MEYYDEAGSDPPLEETADINKQESNKTYLVNSFLSKNFYIQGVTFSSVEFPSGARTFSRSVLSQSVNETEQGDSIVTILQNSNMNDSINSSDTEPEVNENVRTESPSKKEELGVQSNPLEDKRFVVLFGKFCGKQEVSTFFYLVCYTSSKQKFVLHVHLTL